MDTPLKQEVLDVCIQLPFLWVHGVHTCSLSLFNWSCRVWQLLRSTFPLCHKFEFVMSQPTVGWVDFPNIRVLEFPVWVVLQLAQQGCVCSFLYIA